MNISQLVEICAPFRVGAGGASLLAVTRLALRVRARRITTAVAPDFAAVTGVGPDTASTILVSAGGSLHGLLNERRVSEGKSKVASRRSRDHTRAP